MAKGLAQVHTVAGWQSEGSEAHTSLALLTSQVTWA